MIVVINKKKMVKEIFNNPFFYNMAQVLLGMDFYSVAGINIEKYPSKHILEIGCGTCEMLKHIKPSRYCGIDINKEYIKHASRKYKRKGVSFAVVDAKKLKKIKHHFDIVLMVNIIHHMSTKDLRIIIKKIVSNINFLRLIIIDSKPSIWPFSWILEKTDQGDYFRELEEIKGIVKSYLKIENASVLSKPYWVYRYPMVVARKHNQ